jgi:hypothetical protein
MVRRSSNSFRSPLGLTLIPEQLVSRAIEEGDLRELVLSYLEKPSFFVHAQSVKVLHGKILPAACRSGPTPPLRRIR